MNKNSTVRSGDADVDLPVPDSVIPRGTLPSLRYRDMPDAIPIRRMIGPSIILAGLALGSGEYILWPYITYKSQFVFFWAAIVGVVTQYFMNMEIVRWTLATGESAITGFIRLSKAWAAIFLVLNVVPWMIPAWAKGAAQIVSWLIWPPEFNAQGQLISLHVTPLAIASLVACGAVLTLGPVIYETVERIQKGLVTLILVSVVVLSVWLIHDRPDALTRQWTSVVTLGAPDFLPQRDEQLTLAMLLGALAFAGAGGTMNLGQSNYIKDKGYGMGKYIGRITSPITGQEETISEVGYHFPPTDENMARWRRWWRAASIEHFASFLVTCVVCLSLLTLVAYALFFDVDGRPVADTSKYQEGMNFVWGQATLLMERIGPPAKWLYLICGIAVLATTELGVLDASTRISTDIVKTAWLRDNDRWSVGRLYYLFLWSSIGAAIALLLAESWGWKLDAKTLFVMTSSLNGFVMFVYSGLLLYINTCKLPPQVRLRGWRIGVLAWSFVFFGFFAVWIAWGTLQ